MEVLGKDLIFISWILRDGSGTKPVVDMKHVDNDIFKVMCLSITNGTYIAMEFNSYVVKLKNNIDNAM